MRSNETPDEMYINCMLKSNETDAPDGKYYVAIYCLDFDVSDEYEDKLELKERYHREFENTYRWYISDTQVEVRKGWFHLESVIQATKEILHKQKYHGRWLETLEFIKPTEFQKGYFRVGIGS